MHFDFRIIRFLQFVKKKKKKKEKKVTEQSKDSIVLDEADDEFWRANIDVPEEEFDVKKTEKKCT